jgi:hypothetical protein
MAEEPPPVTIASLCFRHVEREFRTAVVRFARFRGRLGPIVAMIDRVDFDLTAEDASAEIVDGHLRRVDGALSGDRRIDARHVGDDCNFDGAAIRRTGKRCRERSDERDGDGERRRYAHVSHDETLLI